MMSRLCGDIARMPNGLDFGWPDSSMATLKGDDGQTKLGVLIDGLNGKKVYDQDALFSVNDPEVMAKKKQQSLDLLAELPGKEIQKLLLCNLAMGQFDIKWDNAIIEETEQGVNGRPYDGGASMPPDDLFMNFAYVMEGQPGTSLLQDPDGNLLPCANQPLDPELVQKFLSIDLEALKESAKDEMGRGQRHGLDPQQLGTFDGCQTALSSLEGIQVLLKTNPDMTLLEFLNAYQKEVMGTLVRQKKDDWEQSILDRFAKLTQQYPDLIPGNTNLDAKMLYERFLKAEQLDLLARIEAARITDELKQYLTIPITTDPKDFYGRLRNATPNPTRKKYPNIFKN
jgi:hypothetical protein